VFNRSEKLERGLTRTRQSFFGQIAGLFQGSEITDELWEELEELLIQADVGVETTIELVETLRDTARKENLRQPEEVKSALRERMVSMLQDGGRDSQPRDLPLRVILVVGVNGVGKTTSIAKLAKHHGNQGKQVVLAAADTFRAAAVEQLQIWGDRLGVEVISQRDGGDPGAVVYDALQAAQARKADVVIIDTAGRLHTKHNLMQELGKIRRVASKLVEDAPHETLLVLDATTGQNALLQAKDFNQAVSITGVILAKLDGTARGGMAFSMAKELGLPILFVGVGEGLDDLVEFQPEPFVRGLLEGDGDE
jgi:fused signal recognition particle receptor